MDFALRLIGLSDMVIAPLHYQCMTLYAFALYATANLDGGVRRFVLARLD
jgi:hypothetical protein